MYEQEGSMNINNQTNIMSGALDHMINTLSSTHSGPRPRSPRSLRYGVPCLEYTGQLPTFWAPCPLFSGVASLSFGGQYWLSGYIPVSI